MQVGIQIPKINLSSRSPESQKQLFLFSLDWSAKQYVRSLIHYNRFLGEFEKDRDHTARDIAGQVTQPALRPRP